MPQSDTILAAINNISVLDTNAETALRSVATATANADAVRTALHENRAQLGNVDFGDNISNEIIISNQRATEIRQQAALRYYLLRFNGFRTIDNQIKTALIDISAVATNANARRERLQTNKDTIKGLNLENFTTNATILTDDAASIIQSYAILTLCRTSIENIKDKASSTPLSAVASTADEKALRNALNQQKTHFGNFDISTTPDNETQLKNAHANQIRQMASYQLFRNHIESLDISTRLTTLQAIANATDGNAIREALQNHRANDLGNFDLTANAKQTTEEFYIINAHAADLRRLAAYQLLAQTIKNKNDHNDAQSLEALKQVAAAEKTPNAIRTALNQNRDCLGQLNLENHTDNDETILSNKAALFLYDNIRKKYWSLTKAQIWEKRWNALKAQENLEDAKKNETISATFESGKVSKSEFKLMATAALEAEADHQPEALQKVEETPTKDQHSCILPGKLGILTRKQDDPDRATYSLTKAPGPLYDKYLRIARVCLKEFELKGKDRTKDRITVSDVIPNTDEARQACRQAFTHAGFADVLIDEPVAHLSAHI